MWVFAGLFSQRDATVVFRFSAPRRLSGSAARCAAPQVPNG